uniref:Amidase domain-containing protein n=2 Tax=Magallana gigas TaxID=29159 RepID=A0A8W8LHW4_MAGGI
MSGKPAELQKSAAIVRISEEDIKSISEDLRLKLTPEETSAIYEFCDGTCKDYQRVYELTAPTPTVKYPRTPGYRDTQDDSWYYRCDIKGAEKGLLAGKTVAIKDNVTVAGVPMMNGSKLLEGFMPDRDATVVTRILDADVAIGGDQGGSIRIPASWCGIVGLKPTYGLVPYTGIMPIEKKIDHAGPMARTVEDCAALLEVIAGYDDGNDPRQFPAVPHPPYSKLVNDGIKGKKIGILTEGFVDVEEDLARVVRQRALTLKEAGAEVSDVSLPIHMDGLAIWTPVAFEGTYQMMIKGNGHGYNWKGSYDLPLQEALAGAYNLRPFDCPLPVKIVMIFSEYMQRNYQNKFYGKAQNLVQHLTREYNRILKDYDVIVMPTLPAKAFKLPSKEHSVYETLKLELDMIRNTAPFNATGHPALSVNAGLSEGLPALPCGMMIVGRMFDDLTVLQVARAVEKTFWDYPK